MLAVLRFHWYDSASKDTDGSDDRADTSAVKVSPKTALPVIVTAPVKTGSAIVVKLAAALAGEARCVAVSAAR